MARTWPVDYSLTDPSVFPDAMLQARCEDMAVELLWNWTGRVYGTETVSYRPGPADLAVSRGSTWSGRGPRVDLGVRGVVALPVRRASDVVLPGPVAGVDLVTLGLDELDPSGYVLRHGGVLTRLGGLSWPVDQDLSLPLGALGTWEVQYRRGNEVPAGGTAAAGTLAVQLGKAAENESDCALPQRVQSVSRQGVTVGIMLDTFEDLEAGRTGIWSIDSWIASVNAPRARTGVRSVDVPWTS